MKAVNYVLLRTMCTRDGINRQMPKWHTIISRQIKKSSAGTIFKTKMLLRGNKQCCSVDVFP